MFVLTLTLGLALCVSVSGASSVAADAPSGQTYLIAGSPAPLALEPVNAIVSPDGENLYVYGSSDSETSSLIADVDTSRMGSAGGYTVQDQPPTTEVNPEYGPDYDQTSLVLSPDSSTLYVEGGCAQDSASGDEYDPVGAYSTSALGTVGATAERCGALPNMTDGVDVIGSDGRAYGVGTINSYSPPIESFRPAQSPQQSDAHGSSAAVVALDPTRIGSDAGDYCHDQATDCDECDPEESTCDTLPCADLGDYSGDYGNDVGYATLRINPDGSTIYAITGDSNDEALSRKLSVIPTSTVDQTCGPYPDENEYPAPQRIELTGVSDGLVLSPDGTSTYVPVHPTDDTGALDVVRGGSVVAAVPLAYRPNSGPDSVAVSPDGSTVYVSDGPDAISVVSTDLIGSAAGDYSAGNLPPSVTVGDGSNTNGDGVVVAPDGKTVYALAYSYDADGNISGGAIYPFTVSTTPPDSPKDVTLTVTSSKSTLGGDRLTRFSAVAKNIGSQDSGPFTVAATESARLVQATRARIGNSLCSSGQNFHCSLPSLKQNASKTITWWERTTRVNRTTSVVVQMTVQSDDTSYRSGRHTINITASDPAAPSPKLKKESFNSSKTRAALSGSSAENYSGGDVDGESGFILKGGNLAAIISNHTGLRARTIGITETWVFDVVPSPSLGGLPIEFDGEYQPPGSWSLTAKKTTKSDVIYTYTRGGGCTNSATCRLSTFDSSDSVVTQGTTKKITHTATISANIGGQYVSVTTTASGSPIKNASKVLVSSKISKVVTVS